MMQEETNNGQGFYDENNGYNNRYNENNGYNNYYNENNGYNNYYNGMDNNNTNRMPPKKNANNGFAIASLIVGLLSVICCFAWFMSIIFGVAAIVLAFVSSTHNDGELRPGESKRKFSGIAIAGIIVGATGAALGISMAVIEIIVVENMDKLPQDKALLHLVSTKFHK